MRFLKSLDVGDRFRVAHPHQVSLNGIQMHRDEVYCIDKVYASSPFIRVCSLISAPQGRQVVDKTIRTLMPDVPVLSEKEIAPSVSDIEKFVLGPIPKTRAVLYKIAWDGSTSLSHILQPQELKVFKHLWLTGRREFTPEQIKESLSTLKLGGKVTAERAFAFYVGHYASLGLIRETRETRSSASRRLREVVGA